MVGVRVRVRATVRVRVRVSVRVRGTGHEAGVAFKQRVRHRRPPPLASGVGRHRRACGGGLGVGEVLLGDLGPRARPNLVRVRVRVRVGSDLVRVWGRVRVS